VEPWRYDLPISIGNRGGWRAALLLVLVLVVVLVLENFLAGLSTVTQAETDSAAAHLISRIEDEDEYDSGLRAQPLLRPKGSVQDLTKRARAFWKVSSH
jgi:hypothetical protein